MSDTLNELLGDSAPRIPQPELRPLAPNERYVRTAGLKFIIPQNFKPGDVLDDHTAAMLNTAFTTLVINRFSPTRQALLENPNCTYRELDLALQGHFENFKYTPRPVHAPGGDDGLTDEDRDLISFGRPHFNKAFGKQGIDRKAYEALLREWVVGNRQMLADLKAADDARQTALFEDLAGAFGND